MKRIVFLSLIFMSISFAQKKIDPTPEHINKAKELKKIYEKEDVVLLNAKDIINFNFNKKTKKVTTTRFINEELINISSRADIYRCLFYDGQTDIKEFGFKYRNKKEAYFNIIDEAYSSDEIFHQDARIKRALIDFPVQGYKYYFEAEEYTKDVKYFTSVYLTGEYPVLNREIKIVVPKWLDVEFKELNFEGFDISKSEKIDEKTGNKIIYYKVENLPARPKEKMAPGPSYTQPHLLVLPKSYKRDGKSINLFKETKDLYSWYKSLVDSMNENPEELKAKVDELVQNAKTDEEKIKNIYYWVQDNIRYIAFEDGIAGFKPDESQNVFKKRYGDCKGMANLTRQMLNLAGFDARLTWIGTKRIAYDYSTPNLSVDNHMICTLFKDGEQIFLDGTEKYNSYGEYANRIQGKQVLIADGDNFILKTVPEADAKSNQTKIVFNASIDGENLKGIVNRIYNGESRAGFLYNYNSLKTDKKDSALEYYLTNGKKSLSVGNIETSDLFNRDLPVQLNYELTVKNSVSSFDGEMYIDIDFRKEFGKYNFKDREQSYLFRFKQDFISETNLTIPEGYKVSELPKNLSVKTEDYSLDISFELKGGGIQYKKHFTFPKGMIDKKEFTNWNKAVKDLKSIYKEQIILTKKTS